MRYLSSKEVSEILGVNISTLKRWTNTGLIGCQKTAGGHRKFTMQHVRDYYKKNHNHGKNTDLGLETKAHKNIYEHINKSNFKELSIILADASLESDELSVSTVINGSYMKGISIEKICDEIIDPASFIVENALSKGYLSHVETFISRKLITRTAENLNQSKPNGAFNGSTALCVNFEDNLPDLGVVMSEIILRHNGYNVLNTGSHAELGNLESLLTKKSIDIIVFYLCDMQCCMATVENNLTKTEQQVVTIAKLAKKMDIKVIFGGEGIQLIPAVKKVTDLTFQKYSDFKNIITN